MCDDLKGLQANDFPPPHSRQCKECIAEGTTWVALRECRDCGHVGCCDSSSGQHATRHYRETQHAVIRSLTPGDSWTWCFSHGSYGTLREPWGALAMR